MSRFAPKPEGPKPFSFSYSKLKNFASCAYRFQQIDLLKAVKEVEGEALKEGNYVHKILAEAVGKGIPLPFGFDKYQHLVDEITDVAHPDQKIYVEQQLAITEKLTATKWFGHDVWFRGIADVIKIIPITPKVDVAIAWDYKTGKIVEDAVQLALMAQCIFAHHPKVQRIRTVFAWTQFDANTIETFSRADMQDLWSNVLPRVEELKYAVESGEFPPNPSGLCRSWCPVTSCDYHGKGRR